MYIWDFINKFKFTLNHNKRYHSFNDLPAIEYLDNSGVLIWLNDGFVHRENNKPAYIKHGELLGNFGKCEYREYYNMGKLLKKSVYYYDYNKNTFIEEITYTSPN